MEKLTKDQIAAIVKTKFEIFKSKKKFKNKPYAGLLVEKLNINDNSISFVYGDKTLDIPKSMILFPNITPGNSIEKKDYIEFSTGTVLIFLNMGILFDATYLGFSAVCTPGFGGGCTMGFRFPPIVTAASALCPPLPLMQPNYDNFFNELPLMALDNQ
jgi:hypothetical protein